LKTRIYRKNIKNFGLKGSYWPF